MAPEEQGGKELEAVGQGPKDFFIILGAAKTGTTSLYNYLVQHPEMAQCQEKEPFYFVDDFEYGERGLDEYQSLWSWDEARHTWAVEGSTLYSKRPYIPPVVERMAYFESEYDCNFRFVYLVRDPIERIESYVTSHWNSRWGPNPRDEYQLNARCLFHSCYSEQLKPFEDTLEADILVVQSSDLRDNPNETLEEVLDFAGVGTGIDLSNSEENFNVSTRKYKPGLLWDLGLRIGLGDVGMSLPQPLRSLLRRLLGNPIDEKFRMSREEERFVKIVLEEEMLDFAKRYDVDTEKWVRWNSVPEEPLGSSELK